MRVSRDLATMQAYYADLTSWIRRQQQRSFLLGCGMTPALWRHIYQDSFLHQLGYGIIWEQAGRMFVWDGRYARSRRGRRLRLDPAAHIRAAHPLEESPEEWQAWKEWLTWRIPMPWALQMQEPAYTMDEIHPDRYAGCCIESWDLPKAEPELQFEESLRCRRNALAIGTGGLLEAAVPATSRGSAKLKFGSLRLECLDRRANHALYLLDRWTMKERVARDDTSILRVLETLPAAELETFLDLAVENEAPQLTAALLDRCHGTPPATNEEFTLDD